MACYIWYSEEGPGRAGFPLSSLLAVPNVRGHPSAANVDLPIAVLLCDGPLLCGFNVANKELMLFAVVSTLMAHCISSLADSSSSTSTTEIMRTHILDRPGVNVRQTLSQPSACEVIRDCRVLGCQSSSGRSTLFCSAEQTVKSVLRLQHNQPLYHLERERFVQSLLQSGTIHTRSADTFLTFKNRLKTELFKSCYS